MKIPERLNDFRVYDSESQDIMGIADVTTPTITAMTETISGAGFAGEIDSVVLGHVGSMTTVINWNAVTDKVASLAAPGKHSLDIRGAMQHYDTGAGEVAIVPVRLYIEGQTKETNLGTFTKGQATGSSTTIETTYLKLVIDGKEVVEIDKYNYLYKVDGTDYLSEVRKALGLA